MWGAGLDIQQPFSGKKPFWLLRHLTTSKQGDHFLLPGSSCLEKTREHSLAYRGKQKMFLFFSFSLGTLASCSFGVFLITFQSCIDIIPSVGQYSNAQYYMQSVMQSLFLYSTLKHVNRGCPTYKNRTVTCL